MTARSTALGDLLDRAVAVDAGDGVALAVDRDTRRRRSPPARMLRKSSPPIEPRRVDAPITATERGSKNGSSEARDGDVVALGDRARGTLSVGAIAKRISTSPPSPDARDRRSRRRRRRRASRRSRAAPRRRTPRSRPAAARAASCSSRRVPIPRRWNVVADGERDLGDARVAQPDPVRDARRCGRRATRSARLARASPARAAARRASAPSAGKPWKRR